MSEEERVEEEVRHKEFKYSIGVGSIAFGAIFITTNYFSTKNLSLLMKNEIWIFTMFVFIISIACFLTIMIEGLEVAGILSYNKAKRLSEFCFQNGMISAIFLPGILAFFLIYLHIFTFTVSKIGSTFLQRNVVDLFVLSLYVLLCIMLYSKIRHTHTSLRSYLSRIGKFPNREKIKRQISKRQVSVFIKNDAIYPFLFFVILYSSLWSTSYICQNSYGISIEVSEMYYDEYNREPYLVVVNPTGFASITNEKQQKLWITSKILPMIHLTFDASRIIYYGYLYASSLDEGSFFLTFSIQWGNETLTKTKVIVIHRTT